MEIYEQRRELVCKVVYAGPSLAGKTRNLQHVFERTPGGRRGKLTCVNAASGGEFEATEFKLGELGEYSVRLRVYTLPCVGACRATHDHLLRDADGVLFVADSQPSRLSQNAEALASIEECLREQGRDLGDLPLVFQWNKRDLPDATPVRRLATLLNRDGRKAVEAVVTEGLGVVSAFKQVTEQVLIEATRRVAPFVDADVAQRAARTCSSRLTVTAAARPDTRRFPRPRTGRLARPPRSAPEVETPTPAELEAPPSSRTHRVVGGTRRRRRGGRPLITALVVATAAAVGGLVGTQEAFHGLASSIVAAVSE